MADVSISHVNKSFGSVAVLKDINLEISDGEFLVLVGPSGCGKSTLLRIIAGLETLSSGDIGIDGAKVKGVAPKDRDIAMVFQSYALYPHMNVRDNLSFALRIRNATESEIKERVDMVGEMLGLTELMERLPKQLSGGQKQRAAMGRAIVRNPKVFLFDEPLSNLDAKLRIQMRKEIRLLHQRLKTTSVYVTHDQIEAMTMADRVVIMRDGIIEQAGAPLEVYDRPRNTFVAGFIGAPAMNFVDAEVERRDKSVRLRLGENVYYDLPEGSDLDGRNAVILGVRPEHVRLDESAGHLPATVTVTEPTGNETQVEVLVGDTPMEVLIHDRMFSAPGDEVGIAFDVEKIHLFDRESGLRLDL